MEYKINIENNLERELKAEEAQMIKRAVNIFEATTGRRIFKVIINPNNANKQEIFGIIFGFDLKGDRR